LTWAAWINVVLHAAGLAIAAVGMKPGTPLVPLNDRLAYLAGAPIGWTLGWATWILCAVALVIYLAILTRHLCDGADLARLGLVIALVGAGFDVTCDLLYILVFPAAAAQPPAFAPTFVLLERAMGIVSMSVANSAYAIAILLTTLSLRGRPGFSRLVVVIGFAVSASGFLLSAAGITGVAWHAEFATGPTIGLFCVWVIMVARCVAQTRRVSE
jgi:hypothetical protein